MQIERLTFTWTPLDESADPPSGLDPATEIAQLRTALAHRDTIGMAKGLLMGRYDVDADAAFAILRRTSQHSNTKLVGGRRTGGPALSHGEQSEPRRDGSWGGRRRGREHRRFGGT